MLSKQDRAETSVTWLCERYRNFAVTKQAAGVEWTFITSAFICVQTTGAGDERSSGSASAGRGSILPTTGADDRC